MTANNFLTNFSICELETCVTSMHYHFDETDPSKALLMWGDARGSVIVLRFEDCPNICFFQVKHGKDYRESIPFKEILHHTHKFCGVEIFYLNGIHEDHVLRIKYFPELGFFMSCSRSQNTSLLLSDPTGRRTSMFKVRKGVWDFDYSKKNNVIVTGGKDCIVRVWNPYVTVKPVMLLQGHVTGGE